MIIVITSSPNGIPIPISYLPLNLLIIWLK